MSRRAKRYWLMKSEPDDFSIDDLEGVASEPWTGVRNYQARNYMRDDMKVGDEVLYYHSNAKPSGVVGIAKVSKEAYPDATQFDKKSKYFDPKATKEEPRWVHVELAFVKKFDRVVDLAELKGNPKLEEMLVIKRGQRLSIQPVDVEHFREVKKMPTKKA